LDFQIPINAGNSQSYTIRFGNADGAGSEEQAFNFETIRGAAWVNSPALIQADTISDEWKIQFFGSTANPAAASMADPDGDGLTNYQEYLAGTNPAAFDWNCQVSGDSFRVRYFANAGTTCTVERSSDLEHWQAVATVSGDNALHEYAEQSAAHEFQYYRVKIAP
jgi:hypothetical protein